MKDLPSPMKVLVIRNSDAIYASFFEDFDEGYLYLAQQQRLWPHSEYLVRVTYITVPAAS